MKVCKLNQDYEGWVKGTLVLNVGSHSDEGIEYQDIGYELKNGWGISYSKYNIPNIFLEEANTNEITEVEKYLSSPWDYNPCKIEIITSNK